MENAEKNPLQYPHKVRSMIYIHQLSNWPNFTWDRGALAEKLAAVRHQQGRLIGRLESLGFALQQEAVLQTLTEDVMKSSEIEGEVFDAALVRSSVARRLGMDAGGLKAKDEHLEGVVEMMLDATQSYADPLTVDQLFGWHATMFPTGRSGMSRIRVGAWRDDVNGPMQVVSGPVSRERVHYQAPAAERVATEMDRFLGWFNSDLEADWVAKAGIAHLWFVTIHPFEDGNGRIARAIADRALARSEGTAQRFYSMSARIRQEREGYYAILERTQQGVMEITPWLDWFITCLGRAIDEAQKTLVSVLDKARFWESVTAIQLNERQRKVLNLLLDGLEGKLTTSKWAKLTKFSQDTAARDIAFLVERGILERNPGGGRSTSYALKR
jgi:Fic family protein